jgi:flagellar motility protein MotE (MotC chaperone)/sporulation protein YlmC with PRC-barrel domain
MAFLSELLGRKVTDMDGNPIGKLDDLVARDKPGFPHPSVDGLVIEVHHHKHITPFCEVISLLAPTIILRHPIDQLPLYALADDDVLLARDVLDKQIIDTDGARVVRVNDLELVRIHNTFYVSNVDAGLMGILRRLGLSRPTLSLAAVFRLKMRPSAIPWHSVELLHHDQFMRLRVPADTLAELHPADVAEIISDLNRLESGQVLEAMNVEQLADTLEEVETEFQASLVEAMPDEKVADVLEEMEPDEAADLLAELPEERSQGLLALMDTDEAAEVRLLLTYPENSAGGIMTTQFAWVGTDLTAEESIQFLRQNATDAETLFYVYVLDKEKHLQGVFSLNNLIFAPPQAKVDEFMETRVKTVHLLDDQDEVAQIVTKYDLVAVPVVDEENILRGIVTADDALDKIIPTAWKKRLPRYYR